MKNELSGEVVEASAPCRVDMGGTLDISTFFLPLRRFSPLTFNAAIGLRTRVSLHPHDKGLVKASSRGFQSAEFASDKAPFNHPLGLMFAVAAYFGADGVHIRIESSSPVRSALGGSSSAAVALTAAFYAACADENEISKISRDRIAMLAHALEQSVAGVPCGIQDQLAAAYGGVNAWRWNGVPGDSMYSMDPVFPKSRFDDFSKHILVAYCGIPHESRDINGRWVERFVAGAHREDWREIVVCTQSFVDALTKENYKEAARWMNRETEIRRRMTPDVFDDTGRKLVDAAHEAGCGARFTGAGGGGCIWAVGESADVENLKGAWEGLLAENAEARLLDRRIDPDGLLCDRLSFD